MKRVISLLSILGVCACGAGSEPPPVAAPPPPVANAAPAAPAPAPAAVTSAPASAPSVSPVALTPADAPPLEVEYPFAGVATIPDDCREPSVVLTTAPRKMGWDYDWTWTRQALLANPQFHVVEGPGKPEKAMDLRLDMYEIPQGFALVAVCHDGATCNKLAAMYRSTVQTCNPQLHCGALPMTGTPRRSVLVPKDGQWLPLEDANVVGRCARIGVCLRVEHEPFKGNPGVACQSAPTRFHVDCAKKATCGEVVQCLR
jgi:hypothetical protein